MQQNNLPPQMQMQQYPQQQMQQVGFPNNSDNGRWGKLAGVQGIFIKQKVELLEAVTGIEGKNSYNIYACDMEGEKQGEPLFKAKEESNCCMRICCPGPCRSYKMNIKDLPSKEILTHGVRAFKCTCMCFNRPEVILYDGETEEKQIGRIISKFHLCSIVMEIKGADDATKYYIKGSLCQMGIQCRKWPCKPCQQATFNVLDDKENQIATMLKKSSGFCKACCTDADYFSFVFPPNISPQDKALLTMATLLIDYQYFEENELNDNGPKEGQYL